MPLLWVLRDVVGLTGTKFGCGMALCGAVARSITFAVEQPADVDVSEMIIRPTASPY